MKLLFIKQIGKQTDTQTNRHAATHARTSVRTHADSYIGRPCHLSSYNPLVVQMIDTSFRCIDQFGTL